MLHREWAIWNQMRAAKEMTPVLTEDECDECDEKDLLVSQRQEAYDSTKSPDYKFINKLTFIKRILGLLAVIAALVYFAPASFKMKCCDEVSSGSFSKHLLSTIADMQADESDIFLMEGSEPDIHEVIEIPFMPNDDLESLGTPAWSVQLLNHTFGQSWGHVANASYTPPPANISFNQIILTLDTKVDGIQYDRLVNIYLDDVELWRSSTIEPAGKLSHSFAQKDVSSFLPLFNTTSQLKFQLDNIINSRLTGAFEVVLDAKFYNNPKKFHTDYPSKVQNLLKVKNPSDGSIIHIPHTHATPKIPTLHANTTKVELSIITSGNAEEEFWYSNVLDQFKHSFDFNNHKLLGHGSCRVVNVFIGGVRVHTSNPNPVIFTGGISPALWNPIVSDGSFHIDPLMIDLTNALPWLWETPNSELTIEISNCIDDDDKTVLKSGVGSDWITSASLSVWEDEEIESSFGKVLSFDNSTKIKAFGVSPPFSGVLNQVISAEYSNLLSTNLTYVYKNGTESNVIKEVSNNVNQTALTFISKFGDSQSIVLIPKTHDTFTYLDAKLNVEHELEFKKTSPLAIDLLSLTPKGAKFTSPSQDPLDINIDVNITKSRHFSMKSDGFKFLDIKSKENGTSAFTISPNGNHGTSAMEHYYTLLSPSGMKYERHALTANSTILIDDISIDPQSKLNDNQSSLVELFTEDQLRETRKLLGCHSKKFMNSLLS